MWRKNIHSLLTLAAEPSEPSGGATGDLSGRRGPPMRSLNFAFFVFCWAERIKCTSLELQNKKRPTRACFMQTLASCSVLVVSALLSCILSGERAEFFYYYYSSYEYSVPVSQLKCKPSVVCILISVHQNNGAVAATGRNKVSANGVKMTRRDTKHGLWLQLILPFKYLLWDMKVCGNKRGERGAETKETKW